MIVDLSNAVGGYLHDVFVMRLDWWVLLGFVAQAFFTARFAVQWIASERVGRASFRWRSGGARSAAVCCCSSMRCTAAIRCSSPGQGFGVFVYLRNLYFVLRERKQGVAA